MSRRRTSALGLAMFALIACQPEQKPQPPQPDSSEPQAEGAPEATTTTAAAEVPSTAPPAEAQPAVETATQTQPAAEVAAARMFEPRGNFATLTTTNEVGKQEPLSIASLNVKVEVVGRLARTEVTQVFRNHLARQTEGVYTFTLPDGAAISRLAMDVEGKMMEGELVERERARKIYESIVRRQKDPALLEWQGGNRFKTHIFPIPANGTKTVVLAYEQLLPESRDGLVYRYDLPTLEGDTAGSDFGSFVFSLDARSERALTAEPGYPVEISDKDGLKHATFGLEQFVPKGPLAIRFAPREAKAEPVVHYTNQDNKTFFWADVTPDIPQLARAQRNNLVIAIDTSAGLGSAVLAQSTDTARRLIEALPEGARFNIVHGDFALHRCEPRGYSTSKRADALACLDGLDAGGATNLEGLLVEAASAAKDLGGPTSVVVFTDGVASIGELDGDLIRTHALEALPRTASLHTVAVGHAPAEADLASIAAPAGGHALRMRPIDPPESVALQLAERLAEPLMTDVTVTVVSGKVSGLTPASALNVARGEGVSVLGEIEEGPVTLAISGSFEGQPVTHTVALAPPADAHLKLVRNFWARSWIEHMQDTEVDRDAIVTLSTTYGVMSRYTSFLVLENEEAYKNFQVARRKQAEQEAEQAQAAAGNVTKSKGSLSDLLAADKQDNQKVSESNIVEAKKETVEEEEEADDDRASAEGKSGNFGLGSKGSGRGGGGTNYGGFGAGDFGTAGRGGGGGGGRNYGSDSDLSEKSTVKPRLKPGNPDITGSLDRRVIRKVINQHKNEVKKCYERELIKDRTLHGKVEIGFVISPKGEVMVAQVKSNAINDSVGHCLAARVKRWRFPAPPGGGLVKVTYPFVFDNDAKLSPADRILQIEAKKGNLSSDEHDELITLYLENGRGDDAKSHFIKNMDALEAEQLDAFFLNESSLREAALDRFEAHAIAALARNPGESGEEFVPLLFDRLVATRKFSAIEQHLMTAPVDEEQAALFLHTLHTHGQKPVADALFAVWLPKFSDELGFLAGVHTHYPKETAEAITASRQDDMGNADTIETIARAYKNNGELERAGRLLSEIVEFAPHDHGARTTYAARLANWDQVKEACAQYASAVQLNPAERDTFRTMMKMRREHTQYARDIRTCIVQGVSKLPVQRDVSLVLTWEDDSADIDLHIHEVGGEEVDYTHRESDIGGFLYYDITDGYGPEIYVLGSGPAGKYPLKLVYYSGDAPTVKGTLTILTDAGTSREKRKDIPWTLTGEDSEKQVDIGSFVLSD